MENRRRAKYCQVDENKFIYIGNATKSVSVRLPEIVYDTIMEFDGNTFSQKLVNLVLKYKYGYDTASSG